MAKKAKNPPKTTNAQIPGRHPDPYGRMPPSYGNTHLTQMEYMGLMSSLRKLEFNQVVELWWQAQAQRAAEFDEWNRRVADPDNFTGKTPAYVNHYLAREQGNGNQSESEP